MSASAVRGGQVYVEIGANPSKLLNALRIVNTQIGNLGAGMESVGTSMMVAGAAITAPIMAAGMAFASQNAEVLRAQESLVSLGQAVGNAVAPAVVGASNAIAGMADAAARFVRENEVLVRQVLAVGGALTGAGALLFGFGKGLSMVASIAKNIVGPIASLVGILATVTGSLITIALSGPVLALAGILGGIALGARAAGVDLARMAGSLTGSFAGPINDAKKLLADLGETTSTTITGIYNSIAAGDIAGAIDILWSGVQAAWLRGQAAIMGVIDPFLSGILNVFDYLKTNVVNNVDSLQTDSAAVFRTLSALVMGVFDNLKNSILETFDAILAGIKTAWVQIQDYLTGATDTEQKIAAIEADTKQRAADRGKANPGIEKRMADAAIANQIYEGAAISRQTTNRQKSNDRMAGRVDADRQRAADRMAAVDQAKAALNEKVGQTTAPGSISGPSATKTSTGVAGTFSAFAVGQMGGGNVQKQQLDALLKIQAGIDQANRVGGIVA
jgi:hypothetical protein